MVKVYVPVGGRLGNQLFYYGYARWLQHEYSMRNISTELILDFSNLIRHGKSYRYETSGWEDSLKQFHTIPYKIYDKNRVTYREGSFEQRFLSAGIAVLKKTDRRKAWEYCENHVRSLSGRGLFYGSANLSANSYLFPEMNRVFVRGVPECSVYINAVRDELLAEITPKEERRTENLALYHTIESSNAVCVSVRRGDYVTNPDVRSSFSCCDKAYFEKAIQIMKEKITNPVFVFFSDDIEWCRNAFADGDFVKYFETGKDSLCEKLRLMYSCKHFIISNSTFSWWAQWLGRSEDKLVVSPDSWYRHRADNLIEDSFIKVHVS